MLGDDLMVIIKTKYGAFEGFTHKNLDLFLGIPYAYPLLDIVVLNMLVLSIVMIHLLMLHNSEQSLHNHSIN